MLRTLLALGASFALAACASSQRAEEGATPGVVVSAMESEAAEKTGGALVVVAAKPAKAVAAKPDLPKPDVVAPKAVANEPARTEAGPVAAKADAVVASATIASAEAPAPVQARNVNLTRGRPAEVPAPKQLIGLNRDEVQSLLGFPWLLKREGTAELWQYRIPSCVLDLFLLGSDPDDLKVSHVELRSRRENKPPTAACYVDILNTPRPAPNQTAKGLSQPSS